MIVAQIHRPKEEDFIEFAQNVYQRVNSFLLANIKNLDLYKSGDSFEALVFEKSEQCALGTVFENKLIRTEDREFPDIIACDYYGIEVKVTKKDDWTSIGNSVLESSRIKCVEKIYMLFGKLGGTPEIKLRRYQDCLSGIAVTHWPRYKIDMRLEEGKSIFDEINVVYDSFRKSDNPLKFIRAHYQPKLNKGERFWWIDDERVEDTNNDVIIKNLKEVDGELKKRILVESFILFPEVFARDKNKFESIPAYLVSKHGVVTSNLRDYFSAGGRVIYNHNNKDYRIPQVLSKMLAMAKSIHEYFESKEKEDCWLEKVQNYFRALPIAEMYDNEIKKKA